MIAYATLIRVCVVTLACGATRRREWPAAPAALGSAGLARLRSVHAIPTAKRGPVQRMSDEPFPDLSRANARISRVHERIGVVVLNVTPGR